MDDDVESCFDLNIGTMSESDDFEFQLAVPSLPVQGLLRQTPADKLFNGGRIVPLEKLEKVEVSSTMQPAEFHDAELKASTLNSSGQENGHSLDVDRQIISKEMDQKIKETRKSSKITTALNNGFIKFLINFPSAKIRSAFMPVARPQHPHPKVDHELNTSQGPTPIYRKLLMPVYSWLALKGKDGGGNKEKKPRIMEINGGNMEGMLTAMNLTSNVWNKDSNKNWPSSAPSSPQHRSTSVGGEKRNNNQGGGGGNNKNMKAKDNVRGLLASMVLSPGRKSKEFNSRPMSAPSSPQHSRACMDAMKKVERESSISSAIAYCKRSYVAKG